MTQTLRTFRYLFTVAVFATAGNVHAQSAFSWTGGGVSLEWSDSGNWSPGLPDTNQPTYFEDIFNQGYTNAAGLVNNIVDANSALGAAYYTAVSTNGAPHFYTTLIDSGVTLTLGGLGAANPALVVGDIPGYTPGYYTGPGTNLSTITGPGTLLVNDANGLVSVGMRNRATLDLRGLNTFNATVGNLWVGVTADNYNSIGPTGWLFLGQTNTITTSANPGGPGILLGSATNGNGTAVMNLGSVNTFNTDALVVGGRRAGPLTTLQFGPAYSNASPLPGFALRGSAGNTAVSTFSIGDLAADTTSFNAIPYGLAGPSKADFSGGTVDIWADSIYIGRSTPSTALPSNPVSAQGTLIVENGTVTATNVFMNYKMPGTNATYGGGSILVLRGNATLNVVKDLYLGFRTNANGSPSGGALVVSNNAVLNVGGGILFTNVGSSWLVPAITLGDSSAINMTGGGNVVAGKLTGIGGISGANTITVSNALSANTDTAVGTLNLSSNLVVGGFPLTFNLGANNTIGGGVNDYINVGNNVTFSTNLLNLTFSAPLVPGLYSLMTYGGTQSGSVTWTNPFRSPVGLVQGSGTVGINVTNWSPATLVWKATASNLGSTNWNTTNLLWNNNTDKFYTFDSVIFDDTGLATNISIASLTLMPANITFSNTVNKYTISQSLGAISGITGLDKWGTGTVVMGAGNANNTFTGPVNIHQGVMQNTNNSQQVFGAPDATNAINIASGAMLDLNGSSIGSGGGYGRYVNLAGSGIGDLGAITTTKTTSPSPTLTTRTITLTDNATVSCTTAGLSLTLWGLNAPYEFSLDLGGHTLTTLGAGGVQLKQFSVTNSGSINVGGHYLGLNNCIIDGPGTINLGANILNFYTAFTTGYVAKAISVANGGAISASFANAATIPIKSAIAIANNGTLYITNGQPNGQAILVSGQISGSGAGIAKYGNSNLVLSAANSYTGPTEIGAGSLVLVPGASLASSLVQVDSAPATVAPPTFDVTALSGGYTIPAGQTLNVNGFAAGNVTAGSGGTLGGAGTLSGAVVISTGGTLSPGGSIGNLVISNNLTLSPGGKCSFECNLGAGTCDLVSGISNLTYGGTIVITNIGTGSFANGTTLKLFDAASYTAGPVAILPPSPGNGLMWDASNLAVDGTLNAVTATTPVVSSPSRLPDYNISFSITGVAGQGYSVRATTNVSQPLSNWTLLQSGSLPSVPYVFTDLGATNYPRRFYRVSTP
jgi:autotransporter-associated beta strand protein